jgi:hypothetical protein
MPKYTMFLARCEKTFLKNQEHFQLSVNLWKTFEFLYPQFPLIIKRNLDFKENNCSQLASK